MKIINIHNYDAVGVSRNAIELPAESEMAVASLSNLDGTSMLELWFDGHSKMFNPTWDFARNRASTDTFEVKQATVFAEPIKEFEGLGYSTGFRTRSNSFDISRSRAGEWTVAVVFTMTDVESGNRALIGRRNGDETSVNPPSINLDRYGSTGQVRSISGKGLDDMYSRYPLKDDINFTEQPVLIVCSQSEKNGGTIRVNGVEKFRDNSEIATRPSTGLDLCVFGSDVGSAAFDGIVGSLILLNKDISDDDRSLAILESHLMNKFGI